MEDFLAFAASINNAITCFCASSAVILVVSFFVANSVALAKNSVETIGINLDISTALPETVTFASVSLTVSTFWAVYVLLPNKLVIKSFNCASVKPVSSIASLL